jgi:putative ABC transport system permease protein
MFYNNYIYIKLKDNRYVQDAEKALAEVNKKYCIALKSEGREIKYNAFYLQALSKITPGPELADNMGKGLPSSFLVFLTMLASVVLLMSVFNFTNLTIAKSLSRAREIGVRKVVGANRLQVFLQFIGEAVVFCFVALVFSYIILQFLKVGFVRLSFSQNFLMALKEDLSLYAIFFVFTLLVGLLAGVLPATYLSAFKPVRVLKDVQNLKIYARLTFRKVLMVAQFTLSVIFVIVVLVVYSQVDFMLNADYGFEKQNNLNLNLQGVAYEQIAEEIRNVSGVLNVGGVSHKLGTFDGASGNYKTSINDEPVVIHHFMVDEQYIKNLSLHFVAGRNFNPDEQTGREKDIILNETAVAELGFQFPLDAVGQSIYADDTLMLRIVGVVKDFHFRPMNNKIGSLALRYNTRALNYVSAKILPEQLEQAKALISAIWKKHDPLHPVELMMMEQEIDEAYQQTGMKDMVIIIGYITFLIVSLACLGLLGMAMYASQIRTKEVGIRKAMGATVSQVIMLLSKSYMAMMSIAIVIGTPVSFFLGEIFLQDFAYRITITPLLIIFGIAVIVVIGLLTIWSQTIKVAISDPVKWLRQE